MTDNAQLMIERPASMHEDFDHSYVVEVHPEFPGSGDWGCPEYYFPQKRALGDYLVAKFRLNDKQWVGYFAQNLWGVKGVWAAPDLSCALVVSGGAAYYVNVAHPHTTVRELADQVKQVEAFTKDNVLLLNDGVGLTVIGTEGLMLETGPIVIDDLLIAGINNGIVQCQGVVDYYGKIGAVEINLKTGAVETKRYAHDLQLAFGSESSVDRRRCSNCNAKFMEIKHTIHSAGAEYARVFVECHDHSDGREIFLSCVLTGPAKVDNDQVMFSARYGGAVGRDDFAFTLIDAPDIWGDSFTGKRLTRAGALHHGRLDDFWQLADFVIQNDSAIHDHMYHPLNKLMRWLKRLKK